MKVSIQGSTSTALCQIGALRDAFAALGHEHIDDPSHPDVAFVFVGNPPYESYLDLVGKKKVIFNVLDTCPHCWDHEAIISRFREQLPKANRVTTISKTVAAELASKCGVNAEVIYYPMKPVKRTGVKKYEGLRVLAVGRVNDFNKRFSLAIHSLICAGFKEEEIGVVGPENPYYGRYFGVCSEEKLNDLYNSVDYVMMTSKNEGIGLPAIEAAICGAIPVVLPDLSTFNEFWAESPLGLHYQTLNSPDAVGRLLTSVENDATWKDSLKNDFAQYGEQVFRPKFEAVEVAKRIVNVYHSI